MNKMTLEYRGHVIAETCESTGGFPIAISVITRSGCRTVSIVHGAALVDDALAEARRIVDEINTTGEESLALLRQRGFKE